MTNKKAINYINDLGMYSSCQGWDDEYKEACDVAIKALEQPSALDKIRDEIITRDKNVKTVRSDSCCFFTAKEVLQIIDKYKAESEDKECR